MLPDQVDFSLHVIYMSCGYDNCVLLRNHDDVLAVCSVCPEGIVAAAPHLVAITLKPVTPLGKLSKLCCIIGSQARRSCSAFSTAARYLSVALTILAGVSARGSDFVSVLMSISLMPRSSMALRTLGLLRRSVTP